MALLAVLYPATAHSALPPAPADASAQIPAAAPDGAAPESGDNQGFTWFLPPVQIGGMLSYSGRRDSFDGQNRTLTGLAATLNASTKTFIWEPWFARVNGTLGFTTALYNSSGSETADSSSKNVIVTGSGQLWVLTQSRLPLTAHFQRSDGRVSSDLALANSYASHGYGFSQSYLRPAGNAVFNWDRNTQTSEASGSYRLDSLLLTAEHNLEQQRLQFTGNRLNNTHESSGDYTVQNNLSLQHSYKPSPSISVNSMGNISRSGYRLQQVDNNTRLMQLSSFGSWSTPVQGLGLTAGARVMALEADGTGLAYNSNVYGARVRNANANLGADYAFNRYVRLNAGLNVNLVEIDGVRTVTTNVNTNQSAGVNYQPDPVELGAFRYNWSASANLGNQIGSENSNSSTPGNQTGSDNSSTQLTLQVRHNLSRSIMLEGGSTVAVEAGQDLSTSTSVSSSAQGSEPAATQYLTHSGSLSWALSQQFGSALVRLSASDFRALDGRQEFFQLVNFQASSNLPSGHNSSWTGNLTVQAVRQGRNMLLGNTDPFYAPTNTEPNRGFQMSSSGAISYQNGRVFGVRRLNFVSALRLNSQALLPLLGSARDHETAAWSNDLDYSIGRLRLRLNMLIARTGSPLYSTDPATGVEKVEKVKKDNQSIAFSVSRSF